MKKQYLLIKFAIFALLGVSSITLAMPSKAQSPEDPDFFALKHLFAGAGISQDQAASLVMDQMGGRVLDVRPGEFKGRSVYLVKVLMGDSRVQIVAVDQSTGQIVR